MKLTRELTKYLNACISLLLYIQPNRNILMLVEDDNILDYFINHKEEKYPLSNKRQNINEDQKDLIGKSLDNESIRNILLGYIPQDGIFISKSSLSLRKVRFSK